MSVRTGWIDLTDYHLPGFPELTMDYLRELTMGVYQLKQSASYSKYKSDRDNDSKYHFQVLLFKDGLLRARLFFRHTSETKYYTFVAYKDRLLDEETGENDGAELIQGWYCSCKIARTIGCCAHVCSLLWKLGYAKHQDIVKHPSDNLSHAFLDCQSEHPIILDE